MRKLARLALERTTMKNRFSGPCRECGENVPVGAGTYEKNPAGGKGFNRHRHCDTKARLGREPSSILSPEQRARLLNKEA